MLQRIISPLARSLVLQKRNAHAPTMRFASYEGAPPPATMDDLPIPSGSWETHYKAKQAKYNMHLALGLIFSTVTIIVAKSSGLLYLNYYPPAAPAPRE